MAHILTEPIVLDFKGGISPDKAERVIKALGEEEMPSRRVLLRFVGYPYVNVGVGWRIGNALRRYSGEELEVQVPPFLKGDWFRTFTRTCLGDAIAAFAGKITTEGVDITSQVREYYSERAVRESQNSVVLRDLHTGSVVNPEGEDQFRDTFLRCLKFVNVKPTHFDRERLADIIKLIFEAIQNVYDHADRKPLPDKTKIVSFAFLGYFKKIEQNHPDPAGRLMSYMARLRLPSVTTRVRQDFIEVCVSDSGTGIAARQALEPSIYWGPKENEEKAVTEALAAHSSVKLRAHDCRVRGTPGQGFTYIDSCLRAIRAFAILRTGRLLAVLDGTEEPAVGFTLVPEDLGYMPGTTLDVLIPILKDGDGQPSLFPD